MGQGEDYTTFGSSSIGDIVRPGEPNLLAVEARGTELRFFVNGRLVLEGHDGTFALGGFGFLSHGGVRAGFDDVMVQSLGD